MTAKKICEGLYFYCLPEDAEPTLINGTMWYPGDYYKSYTSTYTELDKYVADGILDCEHYPDVRNPYGIGIERYAVNERNDDV